MTFNGFISYSHAADGRLAPAVQRGLHRLAKPWHRRRALWIFRDQTGLSVTPALWSSIQEALDGSDYFVLLASPEAAASPWVNREIDHWTATKPASRILPVVTDGEWSWDRATGDFTDGSTAVPHALRGVFDEEPLFLDLRWARGGEQLSLQHARFRDAIAQLAAPMHGVSKDELEGEDVRQHRRVKRLRSGALATLTVLLLVAALTGVSAVRNADRARDAAAEALRQEQVANEQRGSAEWFAAESKRQQERALEEQERAAKASALAERQEKLAKTQQALANLAAAEAERQEKLADQAARRTTEQQRLAHESAERARALAEEAEDLAAEAAELAELAKTEQQRAEEASDEAAKQSANADQQQRIAVSRRLLNQARTRLVEDPRTAMMLSAAASAIQPGPDTGNAAAGIVASTRWAGTIPDAVDVTYLPDGNLVTVNENGTVSLWNPADPRKPVELATIAGTGAATTLVEVSADGRTLGIVSGGTATLWDVTSRRAPARLATLPDPTYQLAFSPDRRTLAAAGASTGILRLYDISDLRQPTSIWAEEGSRRDVGGQIMFSADGRLLLDNSFMFKRALDVTDREDPVELTTKLNTYGIQEMAASPTKPVMAGGGSRSGALYDLTVLLDDDLDDLDDLAARATPRAADDDDILTPPPNLPWDGELMMGELLGVTNGFSALTFSGNGETLAGGDDSGTVRVWDARDAMQPRDMITIKANGAILSVALSPDGSRLITTESSGLATIWNVAGAGEPASVSHLPQTGEGVAAMTFGAGGRSMIAAGHDGRATVWNLTDPAHPEANAGAAIGSGAARLAAFSPDGRTLATLAESGLLTVTDMADPSRPVELGTAETGLRKADDLAFSPDGRTVAVLGSELHLYGLAGRTRPALLGKLPAGSALGDDLAFSPDSRTLVLADNKRSAVLWNIADPSAPKRLSSLDGHTAAVRSVVFSPDGRTVVTGSSDKTMILWDVTDRAQPQRLSTLTEPLTSVYAMAFSPDGRNLAALRGDTAVHMWDVSDRAAPVRLARFTNTPAEFADGLVFSPDGRTIAVSTSRDVDGRPAHIEIWNYGALNALRADPARTICAITGRGLTEREWRHFVPEFAYRRTCTG